MEMTRIDVDSGWLLGLLDEMNKHRSLHDSEVAVLERIITVKEKGARRTFRWTIRADQALLRASGTHCGVKRFAERKGITEQAAWSRLKKLRKSPMDARKAKG